MAGRPAGWRRGGAVGGAADAVRAGGVTPRPRSHYPSAARNPPPSRCGPSHEHPVTDSLLTSIPQRSRFTGDASETDGGRWRLGRNELLAIAGFWTVYAVLTTANRLLGQFGARPLSAVYEAFFSVLNSCLWAAATPFVFWLAWRFGV